MTISAITHNDYSITLTTPFRGRHISLLPDKVQDEMPLPSNVEVIYSRGDFYNIEHGNMRAGTITNANAGFKSNKEIVENSISGGLSPMEAVNVYRAQQAYGYVSVGLNPSAQLYVAEAEA